MSEATVNIKNNIKIYLIENLYDEFEIVVRDKPPVPPLVRLHSYVGIDNKLLILFNKSVATSKANEIIIREGDRERFLEIRAAQGLEESELIEFSGDDVIKKYQILRTTKPPKKYQDFGDSYLMDFKIRDRDCSLMSGYSYRSHDHNESQMAPRHQTQAELAILG